MISDFEVHGLGKAEYTVTAKTYIFVGQAFLNTAHLAFLAEWLWRWIQVTLACAIAFPIRKSEGSNPSECIFASCHSWGLGEASAVHL